MTLGFAAIRNEKIAKGDSLLNESRRNLAGGTIHQRILKKNSGGWS
jgi:hypothetical protein